MRVRGGSLLKVRVWAARSSCSHSCGAEDVPALGCYPEDAGHVGGGEDAFDFEKIVVAFGAGAVGDDSLAFAVEVDEGEHFAADGFVADPEDEVGAPLHGLDGVGQGEDDRRGCVRRPMLSFRGYPLPPGVFWE